MAPMELQNRAEYLSLALFAQRTVQALMDYVDRGKTTKLRVSLQEALDSLLRAKDPSASSRPRVAAFASYEHLRTLEEVWDAGQRTQAIKKMRIILKAPQNPRAKVVANDLIGLFSNLQNQALWNFEQPQPVSQKVVQRLCQLV